MPSRPAKACRVSGCKELVRDHSNQGYCLKHKDRASWGNHQRLNGNSSKRGYDYKWQKLREAVKQRDKGLCQFCLKKGIVKAGNHCDHITSKSQGGTDSITNLQMLCHQCHAHKTATE